MVAMIKHEDYDAVLVRVCVCWRRTVPLINTRQLKAIIKFEIIAHANWNHDINWIVPEALTYTLLFPSYSASSSPFSRSFCHSKLYMDLISSLLQNNNHGIHVRFVEKRLTNWVCLLDISLLTEQNIAQCHRIILNIIRNVTVKCWWGLKFQHDMKASGVEMIRCFELLVLQALLSVCIAMSFFYIGLVRGYSAPAVPSIRENDPELLPTKNIASWASKRDFFPLKCLFSGRELIIIWFVFPSLKRFNTSMRSTFRQYFSGIFTQLSRSKVHNNRGVAPCYTRMDLDRNRDTLWSGNCCSTSEWLLRWTLLAIRSSLCKGYIHLQYQKQLNRKIFLLFSNDLNSIRM